MNHSNKKKEAWNNKHPLQLKLDELQSLGIWNMLNNSYCIISLNQRKHLLLCFLGWSKKKQKMTLLSWWLLKTVVRWDYFLFPTLVALCKSKKWNIHPTRQTLFSARGPAIHARSCLFMYYASILSVCFTCLFATDPIFQAVVPIFFLQIPIDDRKSWFENRQNRLRIRISIKSGKSLAKWVNLMN